MKNDHTVSNLLACAGGLMTVSGILMALCANPFYGGLLWAAASCFFFGARQFRLAENETENRELRQEDESELSQAEPESKEKK